MILKENNDVIVFGNNECGQLGLGHDNNIKKPVVLMRNTPIRHVTCGGEHTIILTEDDNVLVFGCNSFGQLGLGNNCDQYSPQTLLQGIAIRKIACGEHHTIILKENNDIHCSPFSLVS